MYTKTKTVYPASLLCDFYKVSHKNLYPQGIETVYSTFTPRSNKYFPEADGVVVFNIQGFVKKYLIDYFNTHFFSRTREEVIAEYVRFIKFTLFIENPDATHIGELHDLGHLPIRLSALKEGTIAPFKVPVFTIENTNKKFFWITNYIETLASSEIWQPMTSATMAYQYRKLLNAYAIKTTGTTDGVEFQLHDFSARGMAGLEAGASSGAGHLLSSFGTDTAYAIAYLEEHYNANIEKELVGTSIVATEHSIMSSLTPADGNRDETEAYRYLMKQVPNGFLSIVSDTYDFWKVVGEILPRLKNEIMSRDGRVVIRPDSGNPVDIICGTASKYAEKAIDVELHSNKLVVNDEGELILDEDTHEVLKDIVFDLWNATTRGDRDEGERNFVYIIKTSDNKFFEIESDILSYEYYECTVMDEVSFSLNKELVESLESKGLIEALWDIFGGTVTPQGYKVLDTHIGAIYGDSITLERAKQIVTRLEAKGFASTNIVLGVGSFTYQHVTRDTTGSAIKATYIEIDGKPVMLFKDPKTDDGTKRSQRGRVVVYDNGDGIKYQDGLDKDSEFEVTSAVGNMLETVFEDGELKRNQTLAEIRQILHG